MLYNSRNRGRDRLFLTVTLIAPIILLTASLALGQLTDDDIAALQERVAEEGWTFKISKNPATEYSLDQLCGLKIPDNWQEMAPFDPCTPSKFLPDSFDWRDVNGCTPVRNQAGCGSCWAFATVGPLECNIKIKDGITVNLSEQWLLSCNQDGYDCTGGWFVHDYHEWKNDPCGGIGSVDEIDFVYAAADLPCNCPYDHDYLIDSWAYVGNNYSIPGTDAMKQAIMDYGPISVALHSNTALQAYSGGIFNGCDPVGDITHAVVLVGWDDNQGTNGVWFMRNSWGPGWGEDGGYARLEYGCSRIGYAACYIDFPGTRKLIFEYPSGVPEFLSPGLPTSFDVNVSGINDGVPIPNSGQLHYIVNGDSVQTTSMTQIFNNQYTATLPGFFCGDKVEFYVSAQETALGRVYDPDTTLPHVVMSASQVSVVFEDDFETDKGWTIIGDATDGQWGRGVPVGGGDRGDPSTDFDGSGNCYLTDNVDGDSDVDGGTTGLISPVFDLSNGEARVHYARWYSNDFGAAPSADEMYVYISNNNGIDWVPVETIGPVDQSSGGWFEYNFWPSDFISLTDQMKLNFSASDLGSGSVVEAAIDDVIVTLYGCTSGPPVIMTDSLPDWTIGIAYSQQLIADGGVGDLTWSDKYGDLVGSGLALAADGLLSGAPVSSGAISFMALVTDEAKASDEKLFSFVINSDIVITTGSLPAWTEGRPYSQSLEFTGGTQPIIWYDKNNDLDGTGLILSSGGVLSGTPVSAGTVSFTARIVDDAGADDEKALGLTVNPPVIIILESLPEWTEGRPYARFLNVMGGTVPYTWADKYNDLVGTGLSLSTGGLLSGMPISSGQISFTAIVTDFAESTDEEVFNLTINPSIQIETTDLPDWTKDIPYSEILTSTGGTDPIVWDDKFQSLDGTGLSISTNGIISGTPSSVGPISFTAIVNDAADDNDEKEFNFTINPAVAITTTSLPDGEEGTAYTKQLESSGGTGTKIWSDKNGDLAFTGLTLTSTGLLSGNPMEVGAISFTARVEDTIGSFDERVFYFEINASFICGDADADETVNIFDVTYLIAFLYMEGPPPDPMISADVNNSGDINIFDITYLIAFLYGEGPEPNCP